ncbi:orotidine-5'-phosphate decarboxylase [Pelodictyon luteolum]|uniref:Orotidine-5'-phosphate decarboxylase n=1 Tax=Chlorobium luteolum (strain DSM 273 / BCRC 81028 / 2530) TaxID=319225 RepID=Q3B6R2_CHLL3|nr:orotidine-5'-phosphate decarboxylase [Pelodictyon luteolum]ABB22969.1 Orotidine 5'-phosphate decarboxylase subfamily 2 [Pelodictyon luteolum DSM 273]
MNAARDKANHRISTLKSLLCVGLDADREKVPAVFSRFSSPVLEFNRSVIRATRDYAAAYKINTAFYEARGIEGFRDMEETLVEIPSECLSIADAKRADIGNTSRMYARAFFEHWEFDSVTVAPYMGYDSLEPFFSYSDKLVFVLCLTSNAGSRDFEEQQLEGGLPLYRRVLERVSQWGAGGNGGVVVGATKSALLADIRNAAPGLFFLIPGVGAQGGSLEEAVDLGVDANREGALVNISRSLIYPPGEFRDIAAYEAAVSMEAERLHSAMRSVL